jgi:hypothetical protein
MRSAIVVFIVAMSGAAFAQEPEVVAPPPAVAAPPAPAATPAPAPASAPAKQAAKPGKAKARTKRPSRAGVWGHLGLTVPYVQGSDKNCWGGEYGAGLRASALYVRWTRTRMSYEAKDRTDTCDGLFAGDSDVRESAWTGGFMLGRSGFFVGMGGTDVNVERTFANDVDFGRDHGRRYEFGFSSLAKYPAGVGFEVVAFRGLNDVRDYSGVSLSASLGF